MIFFLLLLLVSLTHFMRFFQSFRSHGALYHRSLCLRVEEIRGDWDYVLDLEGLRVLDDLKRWKLVFDGRQGLEDVGGAIWWS